LSLLALINVYERNSATYLQNFVHLGLITTHHARRNLSG